MSWIYHAALERDEGERDAFVRDACAGDEALQREVESLLAYGAVAQPLLERPAAALAAHVLETSVVERSGQQIGPFTIESLLDAGGMGAVYRARDTKLGRAVAIKVLPAEFAADLDWRARLEREARLLAALNHPHIAQIYGMEESGGIQAIVMELVPGDTLAAIIKAHGKSGRGLPLDRALDLARQIADALQAAHEKGIIHRDLKPANIKVTPEGSVKVLDFGLAKPIVVDVANPDQPDPTVGRTREGIIVGTPAYMSPEQACGSLVDKRTDIWAFGCVLYEMLTGTRVFEGEKVSDILGAIIHKDPDWVKLPSGIPRRIRATLERCLQKDRAQRFHDVGDVRLALAGAFEVFASEVAVPTPPRPHWIRRVAIPGTALVTAAVVGIASWMLSPTRPPGPVKSVLRLPLTLPESIGLLASQPPAVSPDGTRIAFAALDRASGHHAVYVRPLDSLTVQQVPRTEHGVFPFWSPDGRRLAFFADGRLSWVELATGEVQVVCAITNPSSPGVWAGDTILFNGTVGPVFRVSASGGTPVLTTRLDLEKGYFQALTGFLADQKHFIYALEGNAGLAIGTIDGSAVQPLTTDIIRAGLHAPWQGAPTRADGHLLFIAQNTLYAQPIDGTGRLSGSRAPLAQEVAPYHGSNQGPFSAQDDVLAYVSGPARVTRLMWFDRKGQPQSPAALETGFFRDPKLSPDGSLLVVSKFNEITRGYYLLLVDLKRATSSRLAEGTSAMQASWVPKKRELVIETAQRGENPTIARLAAVEGAGPTTILRITDGSLNQPQLSPDGQTLMYVRIDPKGNFDIYTSPVANPADTHPWLNDQSYNEYQAQLSPDGQWVAYAANESGGPLEVFVRSFRDPSNKKQVSHGGGYRPRWRGDSGELYFLSSDADLMAASVTTVPALNVESPGRRLFRTPIDPGVLLTAFQYDASADGQRFVIAAPVSDTPPSINVIFNWQALAKR